MNDGILIELGEVSGETKGVCIGNIEGEVFLDHQPAVGDPPKCP